MKILLIWATGMLGSAIKKQFIKKYHIYTPSKDIFDITSFEKMEGFLKTNSIDCIINAAAFTNVVDAERQGSSENSENFQLNAIAPKNLAILAQKYHVFLIHFSTDYVFDGRKSGEYVSTDFPCPINLYGKAKWEWEKNIQKYMKNYLIIRTAWLYDADFLQGRHFPAKIIERMKNYSEVFVVNDTVWRPTFVNDVSRVLYDMFSNISNVLWKIIHMTNSGLPCSWYDIASFIAEEIDFSGKIFPITSDAYKDIVNRPKNSCLQNDEKITLPDWKSSLKKILDQKDIKSLI